MGRLALVLPQQCRLSSTCFGGNTMNASPKSSSFIGLQLPLLRRTVYAPAPSNEPDRKQVNHELRVRLPTHERFHRPSYKCASPEHARHAVLVRTTLPVQQAANSFDSES